ncbi:unnamed protein product [Rotaria sp. Silwood1]|nr:unnamed protein product [Rotaria sp. Silwood1]
MSDDSSGDEDVKFIPHPVVKEPSKTNKSKKPLSIEPVILNAIILNVNIKYDKDNHVEALVKELMMPNEYLSKGQNGQHFSTLHQYVLESTHESIDMSNQKERFTYQPNLFTRKNDAFGPWNFNYLLTLLSLEYQCGESDRKQFPPIWKTCPTTIVQVKIIKEYQNNTTNATIIQVPTKLSGKKDDVTLRGLFKIICRQNQRSEDCIPAWIQAFQAESIATVDHLRNAVANERIWDSIQSVKHIVKQMIKDYVQLNDPATALNLSNNIYNDSDATLYGDIHRIRRYFHYVTKTVQHISYLDRRAVDLAIIEIRRTYDDDGNVLKNIHAYLRTFCLKDRSVDMDAHEIQKTGWNNEKDRLTTESEGFRNEIAVLEQESRGARANVEMYIARLTTVEKEKQIAMTAAEKLNTTAATLDRRTSSADWSRQREVARLQVSKATEKVETVKNQLERVQAALILHTEPMRQKKNKIAENDAKLQNLEIFLQINPKEAQKKLYVKYGRGLLLYGPPGTGKSELLKRAAIFAGITMTTTALAAGELNRPYVGETERLLVDIMYRSNTIPYLICALTIDEIDGLVPKRTNNAQQSKVDGISVLLSHIEGVKNIPNLIVLGATNRRNMMDEAFLRRMQAKCFVGRPSPQIRKKMLEPLICLDANIFTSQCMDFLVKITTNFSGAAVGALKSSIIVAMDTYQETGLNEKIFLDLADNAAREFSCWFGIGTLPEICRLYPNIFLSTDQQEKYSLKLLNSQPTGRILVDLLDQKCLIELKTEATLDDDLDNEETSTITLIARFINGCQSRNIDTIQIIDLNFLIKNNAFEENQIFELLTTTFEECDEYNRSMLIFDIDSLIMLSVSDSSVSKSVSISNIHLYQFIREKCKKAVVEQPPTDENAPKSGISLKEKWMVMIVKHPLLRSLLVEDIEFKKTLRQTQQEHEDEEKRLDGETIKTCPKCHRTYTSSENKYGNCQYHDGYIVDLDHAEKKLSQDEAQKEIQKAQIIASTTSGDSMEKLQAPKLMWACCLTFFGGGDPCKLGVCGLPEGISKEDIKPNTNLVTLVQDYFKKNEIAEKQIQEAINLYKQTKTKVETAALKSTTETPSRSTFTASLPVRRK